ncbi:hypothetical protein TI04_09270, partial [Achromatium sp. WMS2]
MGNRLIKNNKLLPIILITGITVIAAISYLPFLDYLPLYLEEPRRALIAANMLATGNYLVPVHADQIYLSKPPLFNWLICIFSAPFGTVNAWTARLPSVFSIWLLSIFLVTTSWQRLGIQGSIFWGISTLLSPEILEKGRLAEIDVTFACLVTAGLWSWWLLDQAQQRGLKLWLIPLSIIMLAYLTKREPAVVFFYLTITGYLISQHRIKELLNPGHLIALASILLMLSLWIWSLAMYVGWPALWHNLAQEILSRGSHTSTARYLKHVLTYPLQIMAAGAPFSLFLFMLFNNKIRLYTCDKNPKLMQFASIAILVNLPLYWFKGRLPVRYFLPMLPFLLLITSLIYSTIIEKTYLLGNHSLRWLYTSISILYWGVASLALILVLSSPVTQYLGNFTTSVPWFMTSSIGLLILTGLRMWRLHWQRHISEILSLITLLVVLLRILEFSIYLPLKFEYLTQTQNA